MFRFMPTSSSFVHAAAALLAASALPGQQVAPPPASGCVLAEGVASLGAAALGERIFIAGGHVGRRHAHSRANLTPRFYSVTLPDGVRVELPPVQARQGLAMVAHRGRLLAIGGMTATNDQDAPADLHSSTAVTEWSPETGSWRDLPPLPEARSSHDAAMLGDQLVVVGGWRLAGDDGTWSTTCWRLDRDHEDLGWRPIAPLPAARRAVAAVGWRGRVWVFGGMTEDHESSRCVESWDPVRDVWERMPDLPAQGFGVAAVALADHMLVSPADGVVYRFDGSRYERVTTLAVPRYFHRLVAVPAGIAVLGGDTSTGHASMCELLPHRGSTTVSSVTVPVPAGARNRQTVCAHDGRLFVLGGHVATDAHDFSAAAFTAAGYSIGLADATVAAAPELPRPAQSAAIAHDEHGVILAGGFGPGDGRGQTLDTVLRLCGSKGKYRLDRLDSPLPVPRTQAGAFTHAGRVWLVGGTDYSPVRPRADAFAYPLELTLIDGGPVGPTLPPMPRPRRAFGSAVLDGRLHLVGGMGPGFAAVLHHDVLDLASGTWGTAAAPRTARIGARLVAADRALWLLGGSAQDDDDIARRVERYDPATNEWQTVTTLAESVDSVFGVAVGEVLLALGLPRGDTATATLTLIRAGKGSTTGPTGS